MADQDLNIRITGDSSSAVDEVYRKNPAWWNDACYALIRTENKAERDKIEESK